MKSLFQGIRKGDITKLACEKQLAKYQNDKVVLTRAYLQKQMGLELYQKKLDDLKLGIDLLQVIIDKYEDFKLPLKIPIKDRTNY